MRALLLLSVIWTFALPLQAEPSISAGHYQAILGDCTACHGSDLSGGMAFPTPVGDIYATNITPDKNHGIGDYNLDEFIRVMRHGVTQDGSNLYPAMPYTAYAKMSKVDLTELYRYLMDEVAPLAVANRPADISWPLSMRWPLSLWNWMFHDDTEFVPNPNENAQWNRGAYLVQGAAHCGTCHTPRGFAMQEKALTDAGAKYLSGAELNGWYAVNIRGKQYRKTELVSLLQTGRSKKQAVLGPMAEVITHSTQYFTDEDLHSIAVYLTSLEPSKAVNTGKTMAMANEESQINYAVFCSACHGRKGEGTKNVIPALAANDTVLATNPASLINIILHGGSTAHTQTHIGYDMPAYDWALDNQQVADMANMLRASWGNQASAVTPAQVAKQR